MPESPDLAVVAGACDLIESVADELAPRYAGLYLLESVEAAVGIATCLDSTSCHEEETAGFTCPGSGHCCQDQLPAVEILAAELLSVVARNVEGVVACPSK